MIVWLTIVCLLLDVVSKLFISSTCVLNESITIIKDFFEITYVKNTGAAFSIFSTNTIFVIIISILIIVGLIIYIYKSHPKRKIERISYSFILGGAIGNLFDRVIYGYVIDFLDIYIFGWDFPIFNLADICIVVGVILLIIDVWRNGRNGN